MNPRKILSQLFDAAIAAADPALCVPPYLPPDDGGRLIVIGAGKASAAMARAVEQHWSGPLEGLVVTRYGHAVPCERIEIVEAAHPVPDAAGEAAAQRMLEKLRGLEAKDRVLALISGGGSALLAAPAEGISLSEKRAITSALLKSGASISEMNCVRKHLSAIKGGRLAATAWPAQVLTLAISDVPGDDPAVIASGPTVADPSTALDALKVVDFYAIEIAATLRQRLLGGELETPKPGDPRLANSEFRLIASPQQMLLAAAEKARQLGITPLILGDAIEGEAREVGKALAGISKYYGQHEISPPKPCVLLSGGETTVTSIRPPAQGASNLGVACQVLRPGHANVFPVINEGRAREQQIGGRSQFVLHFVAIDLIPQTLACKLIVVRCKACQRVRCLRVVLRHFLNGLCFTFGRFGNLIF